MVSIGPDAVVVDARGECVVDCEVVGDVVAAAVALVEYDDAYVAVVVDGEDVVGDDEDNDDAGALPVQTGTSRLPRSRPFAASYSP